MPIPDCLMYLFDINVKIDFYLLGFGWFLTRFSSVRRLMHLQEIYSEKTGIQI